MDAPASITAPTEREHDYGFPPLWAIPFHDPQKDAIIGFIIDDLNDFQTACRRAGVKWGTVYHWRRRDERFDMACKAALVDAQAEQVSECEGILLRNARKSESDPRYLSSLYVLLRGYARSKWGDYIKREEERTERVIVGDDVREAIREIVRDISKPPRLAKVG